MPRRSRSGGRRASRPSATSLRTPGSLRIRFAVLLFLIGLFTLIVSRPAALAIMAVAALIVWWGRAAIARHARTLRASGIADVDQMDGITFERRLAVLFRDQGYQVQVTKASGDFGADLILRRGQEKTVVQAKRYADRVGVGAIQEAVAAMRMYRAGRAMVVTNAAFTAPARQLAAANGVELIDRAALVRSLAAAAALRGRPAHPAPPPAR